MFEICDSVIILWMTDSVRFSGVIDCQIYEDLFFAGIFIAAYFI